MIPGRLTHSPETAPQCAVRRIQRRRVWKLAGAFGVGILTLLVAVLLWLVVRPASASASILGIGERGKGDHLTVVVTNTGWAPLVHRGLPPGSELWVVSPAGRTRVPQAQLSKSSTLGFLLPGQTLRYDFAIPPGVSRVQVCCHFTTAGPRASAAAWLMNAGLWNPLGPLWELVVPLLPEGREEFLEVWTSESAVPRETPG